MKQQIQVRISARLVAKCSLDEAILLTLEEFLSESFALKWSLSKQYILIMNEDEEITAIEFNKQRVTLMHQIETDDRLRFHLHIEQKFLRGWTDE